MKYLLTLFTCSAAALTVALNHYGTTWLKVANIINVVILITLIVKEVLTWARQTRTQ